MQVEAESHMPQFKGNARQLFDNFCRVVD